METKLLTDREVARIIGRSRSTLQKARVYGGGIPFVRVGGAVRYRVEDVERFLAELPTCSSTSEDPPDRKSA
jgi:excisionase family DNA binding protein